MLRCSVNALGFVILFSIADATQDSEVCLEENVGFDVQLWQTDLKLKTSIPMVEKTAAEFSVTASAGNISQTNAMTSTGRAQHEVRLTDRRGGKGKVVNAQEAQQTDFKKPSKVNEFSVMALSSEAESRSFATSAGRLAVGTLAWLRQISRRVPLSPGQALAVLLLIVSFLFGALYVILLVERDKRYGARRAAMARNASSCPDHPTLDVARNLSSRSAHATLHHDLKGHPGHVPIPYYIYMQRRILNHEASWEGRPYFLGQPLTPWPNSCDGILLQLNYESLLHNGAWKTKAVSSDGRELLVCTEDHGRGDRTLHVEAFGEMEYPLRSNVIASMNPDLQICNGSLATWDSLPPRFKLNELGKGIFDLVELSIPAARIGLADSSQLLCTPTRATIHSNSKFRTRVRCRRFAESGVTGLLFDMTPFDDMDVLASAKVTDGCLEIWTCMGVDVVPILLVFVGLIVYQKKYDVYPLH